MFGWPVVVICYVRPSTLHTHAHMHTQAGLRALPPGLGSLKQWATTDSSDGEVIVGRGAVCVSESVCVCVCRSEKLH